MSLGIRYVLIDCKTGGAIGDAYLLAEDAGVEARKLMCTSWYPNKLRVEAVELVLVFNPKGEST